MPHNGGMESKTNLRGILAMLLAVGLFSLMDGGLKHLASHYPPMQVAAIRGWSALPLVLLWVWATGAVATVNRMARETGVRRFGLSRPEGIGASAVHFRQPDPLASHRMEFNVSFALGDRVVELRYFNVDDAKLNKFIQASSELEAIARRIAERGLP